VSALVFKSKYDGDFDTNISLTIGQIVYRGLDGKYYVYQKKELVEVPFGRELEHDPSNFEKV
jgi:hypothetical protein